MNIKPKETCYQKHWLISDMKEFIIIITILILLLLSFILSLDIKRDSRMQKIYPPANIEGNI